MLERRCGTAHRVPGARKAGFELGFQQTQKGLRMTRKTRAVAILAGVAAVALGAAAVSNVTSADRPGHTTAAGHTHEQHADQASRRDLRRERLVRPLLRHVPEGHEHERQAVPRQGEHTAGERAHPALLTANPKGVNPRRLDPSNINDVLTCDQNHDYTPEQTAMDNGKMDQFPAAVGTASGVSATGQACQASDVMNYYDGNTVTRCGTTPRTSR